MLYVRRSDEGRILSLQEQPSPEVTEAISPDSPEVAEFLNRDSHNDYAWVESDLGLARVLEDLVDVLMEKGVIQFTDLPDAAQKKLMERRGLRREFAYVESLFGDDFDDYPTGDGEGYL